MSAPLDWADTWTVGTGLRRPESVLCLADGGVLASQLGCGAILLRPDGTQREIGRISQVDGVPWIPNGLALSAEGELLITNMGEAGGLWRLATEGGLSEVLRAVDGQQLPATNFVLSDAPGRRWISIPTRRWPISEAFRPGIADGFIVRLDERGARIAADGLAFPNELRLDAQGRHLYVAETFAHRISRRAVTGAGELGRAEVFCDLGSDVFPDGITFDAEGHLWVASIVSNRVLRIAPDGTPIVMLDDGDPARVTLMRQRAADGLLTREDVMSQAGRHLRNVSSISFGGPDLRTAYLGSLGGDRLRAFRAPVAGLPAPWWGAAVAF